MSNNENWVVAILIGVVIVTIRDIPPVYPDTLTFYFYRIGLLLIVAVIGYFIIDNVSSSQNGTTQIERWKKFREKGFRANIGIMFVSMFALLVILISGGQFIFYSKDFWFAITSLQRIDALIIFLLLGLFSFLASIVANYEMEKKLKTYMKETKGPEFKNY